MTHSVACSTRAASSWASSNPNGLSYTASSFIRRFRPSINASPRRSTPKSPMLLSRRLRYLSQSGGSKGVQFPTGKKGQHQRLDTSVQWARAGPRFTTIENVAHLLLAWAKRVCVWVALFLRRGDMQGHTCNMDE
jgi:hypothetical protein